MVTLTAPDWLSESSDARYSFNIGSHGGRVAYRGAEALRAETGKLRAPFRAKVVVPRAAREACCSTMTEQHGDGHNPTTFPTE